MTKQLKARVSARGQITLPRAIRERRHWGTGTELIVEETEAGVLLKSVVPVPRTVPEEVFGMLRFSGRPKTINEMNASILAEARRRHKRG